MCLNECITKSLGSFRSSARPRGSPHQTTTSEAGGCRSPDLLPGTYKLSVTARGAPHHQHQRRQAEQQQPPGRREQCPLHAAPLDPLCSASRSNQMSQHSDQQLRRRRRLAGGAAVNVVTKSGLMGQLRLSRSPACKVGRPIGALIDLIEFVDEEGSARRVISPRDGSYGSPAGPGWSSLWTAARRVAENKIEQRSVERTSWSNIVQKQAKGFCYVLTVFLLTRHVTPRQSSSER